MLGFAYLTSILKQDDKIGYIKAEMEIYIYVILKKKKKPESHWGNIVHINTHQNSVIIFFALLVKYRLTCSWGNLIFFIKHISYYAIVWG